MFLLKGQEGSSVGVSLGRGLDDEDDVVAFLEVDGPTHYRWDGQLRRKDKLKEAMYLAVSGSETTRIRLRSSN